MKKRKYLKYTLLILLAIFVIMQFFTIDTSHPEIVQSDDFIAITKPPKDVEKLLRGACYDCHSYETEYPWYSNIAPVSWWLEEHIEEGREHLNFSVWGTYELKRKNHKLHECEEETEEKKMPLNSYTWTHGDADLSDADREKLAEWFKSQMVDEASQGGY